jgi:sialidase-1
MTATHERTTPWIEQHPLFISGEGGYHTYRIPALVTAVDGTLLAFCEGRKGGRGDAGEIDLLLTRSHDQGKSWEAVQVVVSEAGVTCGNPCPVVDRETGVIWLPFCKNLADGDEDLITQGKAPRTVWITSSRDNGQRWSDPVEITAQVKRPQWTWYATGPGHGIQLENGRLVVPCDHIVGVNFHRHRDPYHSHIIFSDDHGTTWQIGGIVEQGTNECAIAEVSNGVLYINCRNYVGDKRRAVAYSHDGGLTFESFHWDDTLIEPICQASLLGLSTNGDSAQDLLLFANPASTAREHMTVRLSHDDGQSWPISQTLYPGPAAYSDLTSLADGTICCLYERGDNSPYESLTLARFNLPWLMTNNDQREDSH